MKKIILASVSPRRKDLLEKIGLQFEVVSNDYVEDITQDLAPHEIVKKLSLEKARLVALKNIDAVIIAADTIGVLDGRVIGKPLTEIEARNMLAALSGKCHSVITGFTILDPAAGKVITRSVETWVYFRQLTGDEIESYIRSGEPLGKAGGYAIQGLGALLVDHIEGDFYNVVGLPLSALAESLKEFGVKIL